MTSFETQTIASGRMALRRPNEPVTLVTAIRSAAEWAEFDRAMQDALLLRPEEALGGPPSFDESREALLFVEFPDRSGSALSSVVDGFERTDGNGRVLGHLEPNPAGEMTDDLNRTWVLVKLPSAALDGDPTLSLELAPGIGG